VSSKNNRFELAFNEKEGKENLRSSTANSPKRIQARLLGSTSGPLSYFVLKETCINPLSPADTPHACRKWLTSSEAPLQEPFKTSVSVTTDFSTARGLLSAEETGGLGEAATTLIENGKGRETNDDSFVRPRATGSHGTTRGIRGPIQRGGTPV
jgi:hypothetical protein